MYTNAAIKNSDDHATPSAGGAVPHIARSVSALRAAFDAGRSRSLSWRMTQLDGLARMLEVEEGPILDALREDLGKPRLEGWAAEVSDAAAGIRFVKKNIKKWMKPRRVATGIAALPGKSQIFQEPLGVVLIIAPWNYPFSLCINPLVGALAAGNCALIKPSEIAPATSALIARLLPLYVDAQCVTVIEGGVPETTELLAQRFDHIFYTGNGTVGRVVMQAAAQHLTPVTLELGGKSPCIIDEHVDLEVAVKRIAWAKFYNCGQTCVAPDYVLVHQNVHQRFMSLLAQTIREFWGQDPQSSQDFGRIVNARHHRRLMALLPGSGEIFVGGKHDESACYIAPTVLTKVPEHAPIMQDEIFGPILPVLPVASLEHAIGFANARPKPLALYLFSSRDESFQQVVARTSSGGMVVNHAMLHLTVAGLPFGGVGPSGMGAYHGKHSFDTFSHSKAVLKKPTMLDATIMYPPYTASKERWMRRLM